MNFIEQMNPSILLSDNDWDELRTNLLAMRSYTLTRTLGEITVVATVERVNSPVWQVAMAIGIIVAYRGRVDRQWFRSTEEARAAVRRWGGYG